MKKLLLTALLLGITGAQAATESEKINFDIWNKTTKPLYVEVGSAMNPPKGRNLTLLNASTAPQENVLNRAINYVRYGSKERNTAEKGTFFQKNIDTTHKVLVLISGTKDLKEGSKATLVTLAPHKDMYIEIKEDAKGVELVPGDTKKYIVTAQSESINKPGFTQRSLPLKNNVQTKDFVITPQFVIKGKEAQAILERFNDHLIEGGTW